MARRFKETQATHQNFDDKTNRFTFTGYPDAHIEEFAEVGVIISMRAWPIVQGRKLLWYDASTNNLPFEEKEGEPIYPDESKEMPTQIKAISLDGIACGPTEDPRELYANWTDFPELEDEEIWEHLKPTKYGEMRHCWWSNYRVTIWNDYVYIVSEILETEDDKDEEKIISVLYAPLCDLQLGDGHSAAYLMDNKHILIENCGDVESVVFLRAAN